MIIDYSLVNLFSLQAFQVGLKLAEFDKDQVQGLLQDFGVVVHLAHLVF